MSDKLRQAFRNISQIEPDPSLKGAILSRIDTERARVARRRLFLANAGLVISSGVFFGVILTYGQQFLRSDFWNLITLLFSDAGLVIQNYGDFAYSLLETFPAATLAIILIPIFTFFLSVSSYFNVNNNNHRYI